MPFSHNASALFRTLSSKLGDVEVNTSVESDGDQRILEAKRQYRWFQKWTESLAGLRKDFNGDLDQYLLFLVFEQGEMARMLSALEGVARNDPERRSEPRGLNAMSIAEICGIPRETARRKLKRLLERQVISLGSDGLYYLAVHGSAAVRSTDSSRSKAGRTHRV